MSKNLVELMAKCLSNVAVGDLAKDIADDMLSVVKEHIGEVAEVCHCTRHALATGIDISAGCECGGTGIIARTEGDV